MDELTRFLNLSIDKIIRKALHFSFINAKESLFLLRMAFVQRSMGQKRLHSQQTGTSVPPFLIASIATRCNLHCLGCYARANQVCADQEAHEALSASRWGELFSEAEELGVSFLLLAGGEPYTRPDVLQQAAQHRKLIFPIFTNGTLLTEESLDQLEQNRHLIPMVSIEGNPLQTDGRRGQGISEKVAQAMTQMKQRGILYGVSITATSQNLKTITNEDFITGLLRDGCRVVLFVEYVPVDGRTDLALDDAGRAFLAEREAWLDKTFGDQVFISFPGDEKELGGCLAAGRGFFHINAYGGAEPCPFSPYSDINLRTNSLQQALGSSLFEKIRASGIETDTHIGGCALYEKRLQVADFLQAAEAAGVKK